MFLYCRGKGLIDFVEGICDKEIFAVRPCVRKTHLLANKYTERFPVPFTRKAIINALIQCLPRASL